MNFIQLQYFCKAAEHEHISEAAQQLHITQPTLTATIRRLEKEFGISLFERKGRNVVLTEHGRMFYEYAKPIMQHWEKLHQAMSEYADTESRIVGIITPPYIITPKIMQTISMKCPALTLSIWRTNDREAMKLFADGKCDFLINISPPERCEVHSIALERDDMVLVAPNGVPLGDGDRISVHALQGLSFASYPQSEYLRSHLEELCDIANFRPNVIFEATSAQEIVLAAETSNCLAYVPLRMIEGKLSDNMRMYYIEEDNMQELRLYWLKGRSLNKAARVVKEVITMNYCGKERQ